MPPRSVPGPGGPRAPARSRRLPALPWAAIAVAAAAAAVYVVSLRNGFVFDDRIFIQNGSRTQQSLANIPSMFGIGGGAMSYRPVRLATYALDHALYGLRPWGYHLTNLLLHAAASVLVLLLFRRLTGRRWIPLAGALLFAVHPVHADAVTYVSGRKDVLAALFTLGALLVYLRWRGGGRGALRTAALAAAVGLLFVLGLLSKESAVVLPVLLLAMEAAARLARGGERPSWTRTLLGAARRAAPILGPLVLLSMLGCAYVLAFNKGTHQGWHGGSPGANFATVFRVFVYYLEILVFPLRLVGDYFYDTFPLSRGLADPAALGALVLLAALVEMLFVTGRRHPWIWLGGVWFLASLLPVSQIVPHHELVGERFLYLPSVGFCLAAAVLLDRARGIARGRIAHGALVLLVAALAGRLVIRNLDYRNDFTFWSSVVRAAPRNVRARFNLGYNLYYGGKRREAIESMRKGLEVKPDYRSGHYNLGRILEEEGRFRDAIEEYRQELCHDESLDARFNLANLLGRLGRVDEATGEFEDLVRLHPRSWQGHYYLGVCYEKKGEPGRALGCYRRVLRLRPKNRDARRKVALLERLHPPKDSPRGRKIP